MGEGARTNTTCLGVWEYNFFLNPKPITGSEYVIGGSLIPACSNWIRAYSLHVLNNQLEFFFNFNPIMLVGPIGLCRSSVASLHQAAVVFYRFSIFCEGREVDDAIGTVLCCYHCWKGTILRRAESVQNVIHLHKIQHILE